MILIIKHDLEHEASSSQAEEDRRAIWHDRNDSSKPVFVVPMEHPWRQNILVASNMPNAPNCLTLRRKTQKPASVLPLLRATPASYLYWVGHLSDLRMQNFSPRTDCQHNVPKL